MGILDEYYSNFISGKRQSWNFFWQHDSWSFGLPNKKLLSFAEEHFKPGLTAVDIASGNGRYALPLARIGYLVTAIELSQEAVEKIKQSSMGNCLEVNAELGDFAVLCSEKRGYDIVLCSGFLEEVEKSRVQRVVDGFMSWTKPGGLNVIKCCLEIEERGKIIDNCFLENAYTKAGWKIVYSEIEEMLRDSKSTLGFWRKLRTATIVAKKPGLK